MYTIVRRFGVNVRRFRDAKGWSQERLAEEAGLNRTYISDIERGARNATLVTADRLANALGVDVRCLLGPAEEAAPHDA